MASAASHFAEERLFWSDRVPPSGSQYFTPAETAVAFADTTAIVKNLKLNNFNTNYPPPGLGITQSISFTASAEMQWSTNGGGDFTTANAIAAVTVRLYQTSSTNTTRAYAAELLQLDLAGGSLPTGLRFRESASAASAGSLSIRGASGGFRIANHFDVQLEATLDDGQAWNAAQSSVPLDLATTSPPPLVDFGAQWKYLDDGSDQSTYWRESLDDAAFPWGSGPGQLGYGDGDESTTINGGPSTNRIICYYFRHNFVVPDPAVFTNLLLKLIRDDGAVVYLNGTEVFRSNMPTGAVSFATLALRAATGTEETTNAFPKTLDPALLHSGTNLLAVEIHQNTNTSTDVSFDLQLTGNFTPVPPSVALTSPTNGAAVQTTSLPLTASAADSDGAVTSVAFYQGASLLGTDVTSPYGLTWSNIAPGNYLLTAVATDEHGLSSTSPPVFVTVVAPPPTLIPSGAAWRYQADGTNQATAWQAPGFEDSTWPTGPAQLGFGDGDEATRIGDRTNGFITFYFRHEFEVANPAAYSNLVLRLLRDDGGIVYLNGTEVFRSNMPQGPVDYLTPAAAVAENLNSDTNNYYAVKLSPALLQPGRNVMAVEIHQSGSTSSDLSFDLELLPDVPPGAPTVRITGPANNSTSAAPASVTLTANASDYDGPVAQLEFFAGGVEVGTDNTEAYSTTLPNLDSGRYTFRAVATDQSGLRATSAPVSLTVASGPVSSTMVATGSVWRFLDDGSDQGTAWIQPSFNDGAWPTGRAKFGTNDTGMATLIRVGTNGGTTNVTTYFRTSFTVAQASSFTNLAFRVMRDDGVVVYLNGAEAFRMNMPGGIITYTTTALAAVGGTSESNFYTTNITAALLREGANAVAVELHQYVSPGTSWDASFDLGVVGNAPAANGVSQPRLFMDRSEPNLVFTWVPDGFVLQEADSVLGPYRDVLPAVTNSPAIVPLGNATRLYRLRSGP